MPFEHLDTPQCPRILVVIGTRPEAIKLAPVIHALQANGTLDVRVWLTGQHRELLEHGLAAFDLQADANLDVMCEGQDLSELTSRILAGLARAIQEVQPAWLVVQGDTTTAMAAALAGFQCRVPVAHVEAGLRSGAVDLPWPEEMNRRLISTLASLHFPPTKLAEQNLLKEGVEPATIVRTGNTVIDALDLACRRLDADPAAADDVHALLEAAAGRHLVVVTVHRRETLGLRLAGIGRAILSLAERSDTMVVFPAHLHPKVRALAADLSGRAPGLNVVAPLAYLPFVALMRRASLILTDSGGIQEEATALGIPTLVLRDRTERPEAIAGGTARLVGTDGDAILKASNHLLDDAAARILMAHPDSAFGDGRASERIVEALVTRIAAGAAFQPLGG
ncbi:MAG: UDP-N-acetylglucosamine 2-epimerase (non-hydrolyzing) [Alphaproteobacteria bacterium]|nr:MAG: UDP-N-acetylglucosamine 2-epimerase (non-hydrolyzing) [Alphaproteobacteria bacterium]